MNSVFIRGSKREGTNNSDEEVDQQRVQKLYELVGRLKGGTQVSGGLWDPELCIAELFQQKGKQVEKMGVAFKGNLYLNIEEAAYLVDRGDMLLAIETKKQQHRRLTLQQILQLMVEKGVSLKRYIIFSHILRKGLIVRRHPAVWTVKSKEGLRNALKNASVDSVSGKRNRDASFLPINTSMEETCQRHAKRVKLDNSSRVADHNKLQLAASGSENDNVRQWWPSIAEKVEGSWSFQEALESIENPSQITCSIRQEATFHQFKPLGYMTVDEQGSGKQSVQEDEYVFDIFSVATIARRKAPSKPNFSICVCEDDNFITLHDVSNAWRKKRDNVELRFACFQHSLHVLLDVRPVRIPSLL
eukprot:TRINITY_DN1814_c0_g1_i3.p1 TRINITY_DN1814_c0_g1~~TRINITY_DN1814_c0_g1_i3.p1  ORF type:complete len:359 (+),score=28.72 TRINITY_DN1814_c0_g1_i3:1802-2878(+)